MRGDVREEVINPVTGEHAELPAGLNIRQRSALLKHMQHVPTWLLTDEQKLRNKKLEAEVRAATGEDQAAGKEPLVRIYLPDNGRGDNA